MAPQDTPDRDLKSVNQPYPFNEVGLPDFQKSKPEQIPSLQ